LGYSECSSILTAFALLAKNPFLTKGSALISGIFFGLSVLVRPDMAIFYPVLILYFYVDRKERPIENVMVFSLPFLAAALFIVWYNFLRSGNLFSTGYLAEEGFSGSTWDVSPILL